MREIKDFKLLRKGDRVRYCNNGICKDGIVIAGGKKGGKSCNSCLVEFDDGCRDFVWPEHLTKLIRE